MPFHTAPLGRRRFLALSGASAAGLVIAGCGDDEEPAQTTPAEEPPPEPMADVTLDFATTAGVLNYAYAIELLEAAFYAQATGEFYAEATEAERMILEQVGAHEQVHVDFLGAVLADDAAQGLEFNFEAVDFADRMSVLTTASTFENLGVGAYNGAAQFLATLAGSDELAVTALMAAGDIVSVEARHASVIAAQIEAGQDDSFAPNAFDEAMTPQQVIEAAQPFIRQQIAVTNAERQGG
jgi:hypothetical protein